MAERPLSRRARLGWAIALGLALAASLAWTAWAYYLQGPARLGPPQPIPFSHRVHATDKEIDCRFCHVGVDRTARAGVPEVGKCLFCHASVITDHPEIRTLQGFFDRGEPVPWARVYDVPDHLYFSHRMHTRKELDCTECHGDVKAMDRLKAPRVFEMGFCLACHDRRQGPRDCLACHR